MSLVSRGSEARRAASCIRADRFDCHASKHAVSHVIGGEVPESRELGQPWLVAKRHGHIVCYKAAELTSERHNRRKYRLWLLSWAWDGLGVGLAARRRPRPPLPQLTAQLPPCLHAPNLLGLWRQVVLCRCPAVKPTLPYLIPLWRPCPCSLSLSRRQVVRPQLHQRLPHWSHATSAVQPGLPFVHPAALATEPCAAIGPGQWSRVAETLDQRADPRLAPALTPRPRLPRPRCPHLSPRLTAHQLQRSPSQPKQPLIPVALRQPIAEFGTMMSASKCTRELEGASDAAPSAVPAACIIRVNDRSGAPPPVGCRAAPPRALSAKADVSIPLCLSLLA